MEDNPHEKPDYNEEVHFESDEEDLDSGLMEVSEKIE